MVHYTQFKVIAISGLSLIKDGASKSRLWSQVVSLFVFVFHISVHVKGRLNNVFFFFRYHTRFRPTYKIAYKTVTELEWRCCPGHQGPDCRELKGSPNGQTAYPQSYPQPQQTGQTRPAQSMSSGYVPDIEEYLKKKKIKFLFVFCYHRARTTRNGTI